MRVITGKYRGRHFDIPHSFKARPTTDFAKENIFNVLTGYLNFDGLTALDLFAGTGSISFELLSRGCRQVVSVELDREHANFIRQCSNRLKAENHTIIRSDVFRYLKHVNTPFDFIFADPPYNLPSLKEVPNIVLQQDSNEILKNEGLFVFEHGKNNDFSTHPLFIEHRSYGSVNFSIFQKKQL